MKLLNTVTLSVFIHEGEDEELITEKIKSFIPLDFEKEKITIKRKNALGFADKKIVILEIDLEKERHTNAFLKKLNKILSNDQKQLLVNQAESRLDEDFNFFIRFDKQKLISENNYWVTESGKCFHVKMNIACFPRKREKTLEIIQNIFK